MTTHPVPLSMLEEFHVLEVGTTGSGKTYLLRGLLEQLRAADRRVGAIDKLGNHWGLTLAADGKGPGQQWVVFGGRRAQVPMTPADGAKLGRLFVERNIPGIFDVSQWKAFEQESFVADFADAVFEANYGRGPLHLTFDEAQSWAPQGTSAQSTASIRRLVEQGRGNGVLVVLAVQRLARLDITVRNLAQGVIALRQTGTADRRALVDLMGADIADAKAFDAALPRLKTGEGFVWNPGEASLERVRFPANATFDSSRTPKHGEVAITAAPAMSKLVEELRAALAPPAAEPHPDDTRDAAEAAPRGSETGKALRDRDERIAALEEQLTASDQRLRDAVATGKAAHVALLELGNSALQRAREITDAGWRRLQNLDEIPAAVAGPAAGRDSPPPPAAPPSEAVDDVPGGPTSPARRRDGEVAAGGRRNISPAAADGAVRGRRALEALVARPEALTEQQWAWTAGMAIKGGTWSTYRNALRAAGLVILEDGRWRATADGIDAVGGALGAFPELGPELAAAWGARISGVSRMVKILVARWPHFATRDGLAGDLGMAASGGTFGTYLGRLRSAGMLEEQGKRLRLAPAMMGPAK